MAALLDTQGISDILKVVDGTTFLRPMYAGNAIATIKVSDPVKVSSSSSSNLCVGRRELEIVLSCHLYNG